MKVIHSKPFKLLVHGNHCLCLDRMEMRKNETKKKEIE